MTLTEAVDKIIQKFGVGVVSEKRFLYMLCDYHSFRDVPAEKIVCSAILENDYLSLFINSHSVEQIEHQINTVIDSISNRYGLKENLVRDVLLALCEGIPNFSTFRKGNNSKQQIENNLIENSNISKNNKSVPVKGSIETDKISSIAQKLFCHGYRYGKIDSDTIQYKYGLSKNEAYQVILKLLHLNQSIPLSKKNTPLSNSCRSFVRKLFWGDDINKIMKESNDPLKQRLYKAILDAKILDGRGRLKREVVMQNFKLDVESRLNYIIDIIFPKK